MRQIGRHSRNARLAACVAGAIVCALVYINIPHHTNRTFAEPQLQSHRSVPSNEADPTYAPTVTEQPPSATDSALPEHSIATDTIPPTTSPKPTRRVRRRSFNASIVPRAEGGHRLPYDIDKATTGQGTVRVYTPDEYPDPVARQQACDDLQSLTATKFMLPSDITNLLPLIRNFAAGSSRVMELGSRYGASTATLTNTDIPNFATIDLVVSPAVHHIHEMGKRCRPHLNRSSVEGNDLFVTLPYDTVDTLFLDTLHSGWWLFSEMQRFPELVDQRILFHDATSFMTKDEGIAARDEEYTWGPGLRKVLLSFLKNHTGEWEEEVYFPHNSGLLVLRRKDWQWGGAAEREGLAWVQIDLAVCNETVLPPTGVHNSDVLTQERLDWLLRGETECKNIMARQGCSESEGSCRGLCARPLGLYTFHSPFHPWYVNLVTLGDTVLPVSSVLPALYGYHFVAYSRQPPDLFVSLLGCIPSLVVTMMHAASILGLRVRVIDDECALLSERFGRRGVVVRRETHRWSTHLTVLPYADAVNVSTVREIRAHGAVQLLFVIGVADPAKLAPYTPQFIVDSVVTTGIGYIVLRRSTYAKHRYLNFDEPASAIPGSMRHHFPKIDAGETAPYHLIDPYVRGRGGPRHRLRHG